MNFPKIFQIFSEQLPYNCFYTFQPTIKFYVVVLEYVLTSRTGLKKNEKEVVMSVQLNERWKQEQFDNWLPM